MLIAFTGQKMCSLLQLCIVDIVHILVELFKSLCCLWMLTFYLMVLDSLGKYNFRW